MAQQVSCIQGEVISWGGDRACRFSAGCKFFPAARRCAADGCWPCLPRMRESFRRYESAGKSSEWIESAALRTKEPPSNSRIFEDAPKFFQDTENCREVEHCAGESFVKVWLGRARKFLACEDPSYTSRSPRIFSVLVFVAPASCRQFFERPGNGEKSVPARRYAELPKAGI